MINTLSKEVIDHILLYRYTCKKHSDLAVFGCLFVHLPKCPSCGQQIIITIELDGTYRVVESKRGLNRRIDTFETPRIISTIEDFDKVVSFYENEYCGGNNSHA